MATAELMIYDHDLNTHACYARANYSYQTSTNLRSYTLDAYLQVGVGLDLEPGFTPQNVATALGAVIGMTVTLPVPPVPE